MNELEERRNYKIAKKILLTDFIKKCNNDIEEILKNKTEYRIEDKSHKDRFFVRDLPSTDQNLLLGDKSNFLWFLSIEKLPYFKDSKFFWLDADGLIDKTDKKEHSNLYFDNAGFLVAKVKDKYNEFGLFCDCRIDCYYNDIQYINLMIQQRKCLTNRLITNKFWEKGFWENVSKD